MLEDETPAQKPRLTSSIDSQTDSSSGEEIEQKSEAEIESINCCKLSLSIAAVIAEKEHKLMVS